MCCYRYPLVVYFSINSLRNKVLVLGAIIPDLKLVFFVVSQTKLVESFPTSKFHLDGYDTKARKDRKKHRESLIKVVKRAFICN